MYIKSLKQKIAIHIALLIDGLSRTSDKSLAAVLVTSLHRHLGSTVRPV